MDIAKPSWLLMLIKNIRNIHIHILWIHFVVYVRLSSIINSCTFAKNLKQKLPMQISQNNKITWTFLSSLKHRQQVRLLYQTAASLINSFGNETEISFTFQSKQGWQRHSPRHSRLAEQSQHSFSAVWMAKERESASYFTCTPCRPLRAATNLP